MGRAAKAGYLSWFTELPTGPWSRRQSSSAPFACIRISPALGPKRDTRHASASLACPGSGQCSRAFRRAPCVRSGRNARAVVWGWGWALRHRSPDHQSAFPVNHPPWWPVAGAAAAEGWEWRLVGRQRRNLGEVACAPCGYDRRKTKRACQPDWPGTFFFTLGRGQNIISFRMVNFNFHHFLVVKFYFGSSSKYDRIGGDFMEFCSNFGGRRKSDPHAAKPGKRRGGTKRWPGVAPPHGAKVGQCQPSRCRPLPRRPMGPASRSTACEAVTISMPRRMALTC